MLTLIRDIVTVVLLSYLIWDLSPLNYVGVLVLHLATVLAERS